MKTFSFSAIFVLIFWGLGASSVPVQWTAATGGNGHWYEHIATPMDWNSAKAFAEGQSHLGLQGHLATINSAAEENFLLSNSLPPTISWIGGYQDLSAPDFSEPAGGWRWVTNEPWSYENWDPGQPDNSPHDENFIEWNPFPSYWNDLPAEGSSFIVPRPLLVEYEPSAVITNGLVAYYAFEGSAGDASGNGNDGVVHGATLTTDRFGNPDSAYSFDGVDDSILIGPQFNNFSDYTQAAWIRVSSGLGDYAGGFVVQIAGGFFNYYGPNETIDIVMIEDRVGGVTSNPHGGYYYSVPVTIPDESWVHIAVAAHADNTAELYVNGNAVNVGTRFFDEGGVGDVPDTIIGARLTPNKTPQYNHFFSGSIDDVYIYNRALSEAEVSALFTGTPLLDTDNDGTPDSSDNCLEVPNADQADANSSEDDNTALTGIQHYGDLCDGDINNDGAVDGFDFAAYFLPCFIKGFVSTYPECATSDFDGDGAVTGADFTETFLPQFSKGTPGP